MGSQKTKKAKSSTSAANSGRIKVDDLKAIGTSLAAKIDEYNLYAAAYAGGTTFTEFALEKHPRETDAQFKLRKKFAMTSTITQWIIDQYNNYLSYKPISREVGDVAKDPRWPLFLDSADRAGTTLDELMNDAQRIASKYGHCGILVDAPPAKSNAKSNSLQQSITQNAYPYLALFSPKNILDIKTSISDDATAYLSYLRLVDSNGCYYIITPAETRKFRLPTEDDDDQEYAIELAKFTNPLQRITFHLLMNLKDPEDPLVGVSDVKEAAPADRNITQLLSMANETIGLSCFPIFLVPNTMNADGDGDGAIVIKPQTVFEFDPNLANSKPSWLRSECQNSVSAILELAEYLYKKVMASSKLENTSTGVDSKQARSGASMRKGSEPINAVLMQKVKNIVRTEEKILADWCEFASIAVEPGQIKVTRAREFGIDDLSQTLDQLSTAVSQISSEAYRKEIENLIVRRTLPDLSEEKAVIIFDEIEASTAEEKPAKTKSKDPLTTSTEQANSLAQQ